MSKLRKIVKIVWCPYANKTIKASTCEGCMFKIELDTINYEYVECELTKRKKE